MLTSFFRLLGTNDRSALPGFIRDYGLCRLLAVRCYGAFFDCVLLHAPVRPPRVLARPSPLYPPHLPQAIPCSYWALFYYTTSPCRDLEGRTSPLATPMGEARSTLRVLGEDHLKCCWLQSVTLNNTSGYYDMSPSGMPHRSKSTLFRYSCIT